MTGAANVKQNVGSRRDLSGIGLVAVFAYFVLVGDLTWRDIQPVGLIAQSLIAAGLVFLYVRRAPQAADQLDLLVVVAILLFAITGVFSEFPRQSFDSVLVVLLYGAGLFIGREVLARPSARSLFVVGMLALSVAVTIVTAVGWLGLYLRWWALTDWTIVPPLGMVLPSGQWGHRHDLALLLAMLYPAWWIGRMSTVRLLAAIAVGAIDLALIIIGGSRTVWIALLLASLLIGIPWLARRVRLGRRMVVTAAITLPMAALLATATGLFGPMLDRLLAAASLTERTEMWGPLIEAWTARPLVGHGPGSFVWILEGSGYFDTNSLAPRHPDSAVIQLLAEGGVVGALAMGAAVWAVGSRVFQGQSRGAAWALGAFAVAALGGNPTDFGFIVAVAIGWAAFAAPRAPAPPFRVANPVLRVPSFTALAIIGFAFASTIAGFVAYSAARDAIQSGRLGDAEAPLQLARSLDPGLAIYSRQLGALALANGDTLDAITALEQAAAQSPNDDLTWRTLALAHAEAQNTEAASGAARRAVELQRSDATNLLIAAIDRREAGDVAEAAALLAEVAQAWPEIATTDEWSVFASELAGQSDILALARNRWEVGALSPEPLVVQPVLLYAMTGAPVLINPQTTRYSPAVAAAFIAVTKCDQTAEAFMQPIATQERRQPVYWMLTVRLRALEGVRDGASISIFTMTTGDPVLAAGPYGPLNALNENGRSGSSYDRWGYRRPGIEWPVSPLALPSPRAGFARWYREPREATQIGGLAPVLSECV